MMGLEVHGNLTENGRRITAMNSTQHCSALCCTPLKNTMFHCVVFLLAQCFTVRYSSVHDEQCTEMCGIIVSQLCAQCTATNYTALSFSALFTLLHCTVLCVLVLCKHCTMHCNKLHCTSMYYSTVQWCISQSIANAQCTSMHYIAVMHLSKHWQCTTMYYRTVQWCSDASLTPHVSLCRGRCCNLYQLLIYIWQQSFMHICQPYFVYICFKVLWFDAATSTNCWNIFNSKILKEKIIICLCANVYCPNTDIWQQCQLF